MNEYIVTDRTTATKYAISIDDGQLLFTQTTDTASPDPIIEDDTNAGTFWEIYIDDEELLYNTTATKQHDRLIFFDDTQKTNYRLAVYDGQMAIVEYSSGAIVKITKYHIIRYEGAIKITKFEGKRKNVVFSNTPKISAW